MSCSETFLDKDKEPGAGTNFDEPFLTEPSMLNGALNSPVCAEGGVCLLTHVDDIMYAGSQKFWHEVFLPAV